MQQRTVEADADRLPLFQREAADVADHRAGLGADRLDVERLLGIEYQPDGVAATERRRGRRTGKGEFQAQAIAVADGLDGRTSGLERAPLAGFGFGRFGLPLFFLSRVSL